MINNTQFKEIKEKLLKMKWNWKITTYLEPVYCIENKDFEIKYTKDKDYIKITYKTDVENLDMTDSFKKKDQRNLISELEKLRQSIQKEEKRIRKQEKELKQFFDEKTFLWQFMGIDLSGKRKSNDVK